MRNQTLFAVIGWILCLLTQIWWLVLSIVGYEKLRDVQQVVGHVCQAFSIIATISMIVFFATLFSRQK